MTMLRCLIHPLQPVRRGTWVLSMNPRGRITLGTAWAILSPVVGGDTTSSRTDHGERLFFTDKPRISQPVLLGGTEAHALRSNH